MNALTQLDSFLIGDRGAVDALARKDSARVLIISDTHGHYPVFERIVLKHGPESDVLLFAGDGIWDIVQYLEKAHENDKYRTALPSVVAIVAGNGDGDQFRVRLKKSKFLLDPDEAPGSPLSVPSRQILTVCGYRIYLVHGHQHSVDISPEVLINAAHAMRCDIAIFGHTHIPFAENYSNIVVVNPGSPARPRGMSEAGFASMELDSTKTQPTVKFHRV